MRIEEGDGNDIFVRFKHKLNMINCWWDGEKRHHARKSTAVLLVIERSLSILLLKCKELKAGAIMCPALPMINYIHSGTIAIGMLCGERL